MSQGSEYDESISKNENEIEEINQENENHEAEIIPEENLEDTEADKESKKLHINQKIGDRTCATYTFTGEDHTLGNLLRYALIKNPDVEFCGYSITHPSEREMNLRLQTTGNNYNLKIGKGTNRVLKNGLKVTKKMIDICEEKFAESLKEFKANIGN